MTRLTFKPEEVALLEVTLRHVNQFMHAPSRSPEDMEAFQHRIYPLVHRLYYEVLGDRFTDEDRSKISEWDTRERSIADEIDWYAQLIADWQNEPTPR